MESIWADVTKPNFLPASIVVWRMLLAVVFGSILGMERERHKRSAGLRTHILIALAAAMASMVTIEIGHLPAFQTDAFRLDAGRLIEAVVSGIAFLAAGIIIYAQGRVFGLTTGAGMWLAGIIGLAVGLGLYVLASLGTGLGFVILGVLRMAESRQERDRAQQPQEKSQDSSSGRPAGDGPPERPDS